jgi:hypothetical protein
MGTFTVHMGSVQSRTLPADYVWAIAPPANASDADVVEALFAEGVPTLQPYDTTAQDLHVGTFGLMLLPDDDQIVLDTGTVNYAGLPEGFTLTAVALNIRLSNDSLSFDFMNGATVIPVVSNAVGGAVTTYTLPSVPTTLETFSGAYGFRWVNAVESVPPPVVDEFFLSGTYAGPGGWIPEHQRWYLFGADSGER